MMEMGLPVSEDELERASQSGFSDLAREVQISIIIFNTLPDCIEGMGGIWLGKNWSGVLDFMQIYEVQDYQETLEYMQVLNSYMSKYHAEKAKQRT